MERTACIDLPALSLQAVLRQRPEWVELPAAVVDRDKPDGVILEVNEHARAHHILPGLRYAAGLALSRDLRATTLPKRELDRLIARLTHRLQNFTPGVEPCGDEPGVFWLAVAGLQGVFKSPKIWATAVQDDLGAAGFTGTVAVGFTRFGSYAAARTSNVNRVFRNPEEERAFLKTAPIERLMFEPRLRDTLRKLGITTVGGFLKLPPNTVRRRFGPRAEMLRRLADNDGFTPLQARPMRLPLFRRRVFDHPETNLDRLVNTLAPLLRELLDDLAQRGEGAGTVRFALTLDDGTQREACLRPAEPTRDERRLLSLIRLRLDATAFSAGVVDLRIQCDGERAPERQGDLFAAAPGRDPVGAHEALARIRAELGNDAVVRAKLREAHLPEARFEWTRFENLEHPEPASGLPRRLVRRFFSPATALAGRLNHEPDGWLAARLIDGPVEEDHGPFLISGGWWRREVVRAFHFVRTRNNRWLWIFHDQRRRRWRQQGEVE